MRFLALLNTLLLSSLPTIGLGQKAPAATPLDGSQYGIWMNLPPDAITTMDFVDQDQDGIDDRKQAGPGIPTADKTPSTQKMSPVEEHFSKTGKIRHFEVAPPTNHTQCAQMFEEAYEFTKKAVEKKDFAHAHQESYKLMAASNYLYTNPPTPSLSRACGKLAELCILLHEETEQAAQNNNFPGKLSTLLQEIEELYLAISEKKLPS